MICFFVGSPFEDSLGLSGPLWATLGLSVHLWAPLGFDGPLRAALGLAWLPWGPLGSDGPQPPNWDAFSILAVKVTLRALTRAVQSHSCFKANIEVPAGGS